MIHNHKKKYLLIFITIIGLIGCANADHKRALFNAQLDVFKQTDVYHQVLLSARQNLKKWISERLEGIQVLNKSNWKIDDAVFFNKKRDKCYLLLLIQDKEAKAELDYVYVMYGALEHEQWAIYFSGLPTMVFPRGEFSKNEHEPVPLTTLSALSRDKILRNYYKANRHINDEYVNKVYNDELKKKQEQFLKKKH